MRSPANLQALFESVIPSLQVESAVNITGDGQNNDVWLINDAWIARFPKHESARRSLQNELVALHALRGRLTVAVPDPIFADERCMVYRRLSGEPLAVEVRGWSRAARREVARSLAAFMRSLRNTPTEGLMLPIRDDAASWRNVYERARHGLFSLMRPEAHQRYEASFGAYLGDAANFTWAPRLRHGDLGGSNLLFDPERRELTGVLDFGSVALGDSASDLASVAATFGEAFVNDIIEFDPDLAAMRARAAFIASTFGVQEALLGLEAGDNQVVQSGLQGDL